MNGIDKASLINGRKDLQLADALTKISPEAQKKTLLFAAALFT